MLHFRAAIGLGEETLSGNKGTDFTINQSQDISKFIMLTIAPYNSIISQILQNRFNFG